MTYTDTNTEGFTFAELSVMNVTYDRIIQNVNAEFEGDTQAVSTAVLDEHQPGDTADMLIARVLAQHPSFAAA